MEGLQHLAAKLADRALIVQHNGAFIELFYASFFIVKTVLAEDARMPHPVQLYASDDRYVAQELVGRREFPVEAIVEALGRMAQPELMAEMVIGDASDDATEAVAPIALSDD